MPEISYLLAVAVSPCPVQEEWLAAVINNSFDKLISLVETDWTICHLQLQLKLDSSGQGRTQVSQVGSDLS